MKNFINFYYGFNVYDFIFSNDKYFFNNGKDRYMLKKITNPEFLPCYIKLQRCLLRYQYFFLIVLNKDNNYLTWIENKPYILLKLTNIPNHRISIFDIKSDFYIDFDKENFLLNRYPWIRLWEDKIDYFEHWFYNKYDSYKKLYSLFHYFIGIAENALLYLKESEISEKKENIDRLVIAHDRLHFNYQLYDYYDVTNLIVDHASRDICEYLKSTFVNKVWDLDLLRDYLSKNYFSRYGLRLMYARLLFPSFFFDYIDKMIVNNCSIDFVYLETRVNDFRDFIKEISLFFKDEYDIPVITWTIKKI